MGSEEIYSECLELGYKLSNAERRLRHSESPDIEPVMATSKRGTNYIKGYQVKGFNAYGRVLAKFPTPFPEKPAEKQTKLL
jgi:hypothetical protein